MIAISRVDAEDRETFAALMDLSVLMAEEMALVPVNPEKAAIKVHGTIEAGLAWIARRDTSIVGAIGLKEVPFDYGDDTFLLDSFLYVAAGERFGEVGVKLMRAVRDHAEDRHKILFIGVMNPTRRQKKTELGLYLEVAGFLPFGHLTRIT